MLWIDLVAKGRQAHGAHVHAGDNAVDHLIDALTELRQLEALPVHSPQEALEIIGIAGETDGAGSSAARETMRRVTVNAGYLNGGTSANLVPAFAAAGLDIRLPLGVSVSEAEAATARIIAHHPAIELKASRRYEPTWTAPNAAIATACLEAGKRVLDTQVSFDMRIGGSDARLWRRAGMETVVNGLTPHNLGAPDEHLETEELSRLLAVQCIATSIFLTRA